MMPAIWGSGLNTLSNVSLCWNLAVSQEPKRIKHSIEQLSRRWGKDSLYSTIRFLTHQMRMQSGVQHSAYERSP